MFFLVYFRDQGTAPGLEHLPLASFHHGTRRQPIWGRHFLPLPQGSIFLSVPAPKSPVPNQDLPSKRLDARGHWDWQPPLQLGLRADHPKGAVVHPVPVDRRLLWRMHGTRDWEVVPGRPEDVWRCRTELDMEVCHARCHPTQPQGVKDKQTKNTLDCLYYVSLIIIPVIFVRISLKVVYTGRRRLLRCRNATGSLFAK